MTTYDAIIVGARCGGSPLAMLLARAGHRVLLVDRMAFGSDIMSTHYVKRTGAAYLKDWGLLDEVLDAGTPAIANLNFHIDDVHRQDDHGLEDANDSRTIGKRRNCTAGSIRRLSCF